MFPMKNLILGIENLYFKLLFKPISIFEMKFNLNVKYWSLTIFRIFLHMFLCSKYANCADLAFFGLNAVRSLSNDWNELVSS